MSLVEGRSRPDVVRLSLGCRGCCSHRQQRERRSWGGAVQGQMSQGATRTERLSTVTPEQVRPFCDLMFTLLLMYLYSYPGIFRDLFFG